MKLAPQVPTVETAATDAIEAEGDLAAGIAPGTQVAEPAAHDARPVCFRPEPGLLVKLGSLAVHAEELLEPGGHELDAASIRGLLADPEVAAWLGEMRELALLPLKRSGS